MTRAISHACFNNTCQLPPKCCTRRVATGDDEVEQRAADRTSELDNDAEILSDLRWDEKTISGRDVRDDAVVGGG